MTADGLDHRLVVSQLGARMHYAVPRLLSASGHLQRFYTDICADRGWPRLLAPVPRQVQPAAVRRLTGRVVTGVPRSKITSFTTFGLRLALKRARAKTPSQQTAVALWAGRELSRRVAAAGFRGATGLYAFSGECRELLAAARAAGLRTAVEQVIAPRAIEERLIGEEEAAFPGWQVARAEDRFAAEYADRERDEWALADAVLCGSEFVRTGVIAEGGDPRRCFVVPYGVEVQTVAPPRRDHGGPLRVLTIGGVGLRKGSPYVMEAARRMGREATFRMVGPCGLLPAARAALARSVELVGPVPRSDVAAHLAWADVFLLPSLCEGSATAVYEALAVGLPVVTTENTGTVVRHGTDGFIVPIRDAEAIVEALSRLAADPELRREMGHNAAQRARDHDLVSYGRRLRRALAAAWRSADNSRSRDHGHDALAC